MKFNTNLKDVEVICHFKADGSIVPLKIKVSDEEGIAQVFAIRQCKQPKEQLHSELGYQGRMYSNVMTMDYDCMINVFGINKLIKLRYFLSEHQWKIFIH